MQTLNILFINSSPLFGGTERWTMLASHVLQERGHRVYLGYRYDTIRKYSEEYELPSVYFPLRNDADWYSVKRIWRFLKEKQIQLVVSTKVREYWLGTLAARIAKRKSILRLGILRPVRNKLKNRLLYGKWADAILVNTEAIAAQLRATEFIPPEKVHVIYNGVKMPEGLPEFRRISSPFVLLFVGNLFPRKKVGSLIRIFQKLKELNRNVKMELWIAGHGPEENRLRQLAVRLAVEKEVKFLGSRNDVDRLLKQAHAFVMLSESEGFPNAVLEAMANGLPVIINKVSGVEEIVTNKETGILVDATRDDEVLSALNLILQNTELRYNLGKNAYNYIKNNHSLVLMGMQLEKFMFGVLNENGK